MSPKPAQFLDKGHGKTAPWLDLVNSEEWDTYGKRTDWLDDPSWLRFFATRWHFARRQREPFPLERWKELRATLREACDALASGKMVPARLVDSLNQALDVAGKHQLQARPGGLQVAFVGISDGWDWILGQTVLSFALLLARGEARRIKICQNSDCKWVFYDKTKARVRRWCSDKVCGNRERVRRSRARRAH